MEMQVRPGDVLVNCRRHHLRWQCARTAYITCTSSSAAWPTARRRWHHTYRTTDNHFSGEGLRSGSACGTTPLDAATPASTSPEAPQAWQERTALLLGTEGLARLHNARILIVGLGGVGSVAAEFLARAGVGSLTLVDGDTVDVSNANRQLPALTSTVGAAKVDVMAARLQDACPGIILNPLNRFLLPGDAEALLASGALGQDGTTAPYDWVVDAIDSVEPKKQLIAAAKGAGVAVLSAMGAGGRLDPSRVRVVPMAATFNDPFATNLRKGLRRRGVDISRIPVVWSDEPVTQDSLLVMDTRQRFKRSYHGTVSFLPAQFGLLAAGHIINDLVGGPMAAAFRQHKGEGWLKAARREAVARKRAQAERHRLRQGGARAPSTPGLVMHADDPQALPHVFYSSEQLQKSRQLDAAHGADPGVGMGQATTAVGPELDGAKAPDDSHALPAVAPSHSAALLADASYLDVGAGI